MWGRAKPSPHITVLEQSFLHEEAAGDDTGVFTLGGDASVECGHSIVIER
jgi:hypothetical protein